MARFCSAILDGSSGSVYNSLSPDAGGHSYLVWVKELGSALFVSVHCDAAYQSTNSFAYCDRLDSIILFPQGVKGSPVIHLAITFQHDPLRSILIRSANGFASAVSSRASGQASRSAKWCGVRPETSPAEAFGCRLIAFINSVIVTGGMSVLAIKTGASASKSKRPSSGSVSCKYFLHSTSCTSSGSVCTPLECRARWLSLVPLCTSVVSSVACSWLVSRV